VRRQPQLLELGDRRARGAVELELGETVTTPERERFAQARSGGRGVVAQHGVAALDDEAFEPGCVELAGSEMSGISGHPGHERVGAELLAQPRDVHLQGVRGGTRRRLAPHLVDQPLHRDDLARM
jgi:hypothetical protein